MNTDLIASARNYGKERLDIASKCTSAEDWDRLWTEHRNDYPFKWGECWKQCIEYIVDDYAAEVGFYIDILGLKVNAFSDEFAMFTGPDSDFYFAVVPKTEKAESTPTDSIRLQFMIEDIMETASELENRGIEFDKKPEPFGEGSSLYHGFFRSPHGIPIDLWGVVKSD